MDLQTQLDLANWMDAIGPLVDAAEVRAYTPSRWAIAFDTDLAVEIEYDAPSGKLVLSAELGIPPSGQAAAVNRLLLYACGQRGDTGASRMSLDALDSSVWQIDDIFLAGLSLDAFVVFVREFAQQAHHARTEIDLLAESSPADVSEPPRLFTGFA